MTLDERLVKLTERHEALTGHVELLTVDVRKMRSVMDDLMTGFRTLIEPVRNPELRIERLEGR
jgi:hypothetical protein